MVAADKQGDGENVETLQTKFDQVKLELGQATPKVKILFERLLKLRERQDQQLHSLKVATDLSEDCVNSHDRDSAVTTVKSMQRFYNYNSDTLADAVHYMDRFISKVKVKKRYMSCVAAAAFYLATKMNEELEYQPTATDLSNLHRQSWKPTDLKRMEKVLLEKLDWNLFPSVTTLAYIKLISRVLALINKDIDRDILEMLVERSELYMNYTRCAQYSACTLAVSIIHQCLKEADVNSVMTKYLLLHVQAVCRISDSELLSCQCAISNQLQLHNTHPETHPRCLPMPKIVPRPNLIRKPSFYGSTDLPTIEEVSWLAESSEESELSRAEEHQCHELVTYYPTCPVQSSHHSKTFLKPGQTCCQLLDQSFQQRAFINHRKCNITVL